MKQIAEYRGLTPEQFHAEILVSARPVVMRGLVAEWPVVAAGRTSPQALSAYMRRLDRGQPVSTMIAPPSAKGRLFYNEDLSGFNFRLSTTKLSAAFDYLLGALDEDNPSVLAAQSVPVRANLNGFESENEFPLLPNVEPRIWIGNAAIVATHHDPSENIACVVAGRRRFTLFPPEQIGNLYMGPFELTPAGATISMASLEEPDFERYPRLRAALDAAHVAELAPGDAIYIPYLWWHHVRALDGLNMLVNYWWAPPTQGRGAPREALLHAMLAVGRLPAAHRAAWKAVFDHYVFGPDGEAGAHLPPARRGILGEMGAEAVRNLRAMLARQLSGRGD